MYASNDQVEYLIGDVLQDLLKKHDSILMPKLTTIVLSKEGKCALHIKIDPNKHLNLPRSNVQYVPTNSGFVHKVSTFLHWSKDNSRREEEHTIRQAQKASDDFFTTAKDSFRKIRGNFHNFDRSYAYDLLKEFINTITDYSKKHEYVFTAEYVVDMALKYASYMAAEFIKLMDEVRTANDPMASFKRLRETYFNTFLAQYRDISGDDTAASNLCRLLRAAIETAVIQILPTQIADHMKEKDTCFKQKRFLKVRVLKDLAKQKNFGLFKTYLEDIKSSYESWTKLYVKEFCMVNRNWNYITLARSIVHDIMIKIDAIVKDLDKNMPIKQWLQKFHGRLGATLTLDLGEMEDIIGATHVGSSNANFINTFSEQFRQEEEKIMKLIADPNSKFSDITESNNSPHLILCDSLMGCTERCPFCREQCELTDPNHAECGKDHFINIHRPQCLGTYTWNISKKLVLDLCTYSVESDCTFRNADTNDQWVPYKDYRSIYKNWCISNESPTEAPKYWQWFIFNYLDEITEWAGAVPTSIDHLNWGAVSPEMAVASLSEVYKIT